MAAKKKLTIKIGCDPEVFIKDSKGRFVSAHGLVPGTKYDPHGVLDGMVQVDGMALEFGITPALTGEQFFTRVNAVMDQLKSMVPKHQLVIAPFAVFDPEYFEKHVPNEAKELGCHPDFNAWTGEVNPKPDPSKVNPYMRTAAGHIHIGWTENEDPMDPVHFEDCCNVTKQLDYYLGCHSLLVDTDPTRRQLYGKAGAFRPKTYGCEYRGLSNWWLKQPYYIDWVYYYTRAALSHMFKGKFMPNKHGDVARKIIDENQTKWYTKYKLGMDVHNPNDFRGANRGPLWA